MALGAEIQHSSQSLSPLSPSHSRRFRKEIIDDDNDDYAGSDDPLIAYLGFSAEDQSSKGSLIKKKRTKASQPLPRIVYEINRTSGSSKSSDNGICRRRYQSYAEKIAASSYDQSKYEELLRVKRNKQSEKLGLSGYTTTGNLSNVLNALERQSFTLSLDDPELLVTFDSSEDSINQFIEREAQIYREAKLYQDIEAELIETVGVIERIGRNRGDWRHSVIHINEADRINIVNACALELDALNRTARQQPKNQQHSLDVCKKPSFREKLRRSFKQHQKSVKTINEVSDEDGSGSKCSSREVTPVAKRSYLGKSPKTIRKTPSPDKIIHDDKSSSSAARPNRLQSNNRDYPSNNRAVGFNGKPLPVIMVKPVEGNDEDIFKPLRNKSKQINPSDNSSTATKTQNQDSKTATTICSQSKQNREEINSSGTNAIITPNGSLTTSPVSIPHPQKSSKSKSPSIIRRWRNGDKSNPREEESNHLIQNSPTMLSRSFSARETEPTNTTNKPKVNTGNRVIKNRSFNLGKVFPNFSKKHSKSASVVAVVDGNFKDCTNSNNEESLIKPQPVSCSENSSTTTDMGIKDQFYLEDVTSNDNAITNSSEINCRSKEPSIQEEPAEEFLYIDLSSHDEISVEINEKASIDSFLQITNHQHDYSAVPIATLDVKGDGPLAETTKSIDVTFGNNLSKMASTGASFDSTSTSTNTNSEESEFEFIDKDDPALLFHHHQQKQNDCRKQEESKDDDMDLSSLIDFAAVLSSCKS